MGVLYLFSYAAAMENNNNLKSELVVPQGYTVKVVNEVRLDSYGISHPEPCIWKQTDVYQIRKNAFYGLADIKFGFSEYQVFDEKNRTIIKQWSMPHQWSKKDLQEGVMAVYPSKEAKNLIKKLVVGGIVIGTFSLSPLLN